MRKIRLILQYDGTAYSGWQFQPDAPSIQGTVEAAIAKVTGEHVRVAGAGRTDAGVHALGQVAAFRSSSRLQDDVILRALNASLPQDIRIVDAETVDDRFHPRKDAVGKKYVYLIQNRRIPSVFLDRWTWFVPGSIDTDAMNEALSYLVGRHDFSSFRTSGGDAISPVRTINSIEIFRDEKTGFLGFLPGDGIIRIEVEGDGFLRHMVRSMVGVAVRAGQGMLMPEGVGHILESRDRSAAGTAAPGRGLFLDTVYYDDKTNNDAGKQVI